MSFVEAITEQAAIDGFRETLTRTSRNQKGFNHEGHQGTQRKINKKSFVTLCALCGEKFLYTPALAGGAREKQEFHL
jgi:hypothetical protein